MMNRIWLFMPLLPPLMPLLVACQNDSLTRFLNGDIATSATVNSEQRMRYATGNTVSQAKLNRLRQFAPGQTTQEVHSVIGFPDSYTREADYYWTTAGGMVKIPYDSAGKWTGAIETVEAPKWVASPYPGARQ